MLFLQFLLIADAKIDKIFILPNVLTRRNEILFNFFEVNALFVQFTHKNNLKLFKRRKCEDKRKKNLITTQKLSLIRLFYADLL